MEGNAMGGCDMVHAVEAPHEVEMPPAATEFTIGDDMQTGGFCLATRSVISLSSTAFNPAASIIPAA